MVSTVSRYRRPVYRPRTMSAVGARTAWQIGQGLRRKYNQYSGGKRARTVTTKPKMRKPVKRFYTVGKMGKSFSKPKASPVSAFLKVGYVEAVEDGGEIASTECPYVGHALAHEKLLFAAVAAVVRRMMQNMGFRIASWDDVIVQTSSLVVPGGYRLVYRASSGAAFTEVTAAFALDTSWKAVVAQIVFSIQTAISSNTISDGFSVDELIFYQNDSVGGQIAMARSRVFLSSVMLHFNCSSSLSLQNRTRASSDVADGDVYSTDNILNNPLGGKSYEGSGTGAQLKEDSNSLVAGTKLVANSQSGLINMDWDATHLSAAQKAILRRPPPKTAFLHVRKQGVAGIKPGEIRTSRLSYVQTLSFTKFVEKMHTILVSSAIFQDMIIPIGSFRFYAFEKRCNTRVNEGNIELGYELNNVYRCKMTTTNSGCAVVQTIL